MSIIATAGTKTMLSRLFQRKPSERVVARLYGRIVEQSRLPTFFTAMGVPDSLEGRFEMVALHAWLVMRRLAMGGQETRAFNQALFDFMFADMDFNLREMGAGDMKVGDRVKELASHYYGRVAAYDEGLDAPDPALLPQAIDRNLYGSTLPAPEYPRAMSDYVRRQWAVLSVFPVQRLLLGEVDFAAPDATTI